VLCKNSRVVDLVRSAQKDFIIVEEDLRVHHQLLEVLERSLAFLGQRPHLEASFGRQSLCCNVAICSYK
jgi:hypothetical protein